ncbi:MAG TPA: hypothetical protein VEX35_00655 [Allosphingosinicella sp.]|nr:hypothetical protein [Allosphingosinicella sp.]
MKIWTLPLLALVAACSQNSGNRAKAGNNAAAPADDSAAAAPAPAQGAQQAGMPPGLDCVRNRLSPEQRREFAQLAMERGSRDDPRAQPVLQAVEACGSELAWSPEKRQLASLFTMSAAGAAGIREQLGAQGANFDALDQAILSDREFMAAAEAGQLDGSVGQAFYQRHAALIQPMVGGEEEDPELATLIGNYIAFRALAETTAGKFGREP